MSSASVSPESAERAFRHRHIFLHADAVERKPGILKERNRFTGFRGLDDPWCCLDRIKRPTFAVQVTIACVKPCDAIVRKHGFDQGFSFRCCAGETLRVGGEQHAEQHGRLRLTFLQGDAVRFFGEGCRLRRGVDQVR